MYLLLLLKIKIFHWKIYTIFLNVNLFPIFITCQIEIIKFHQSLICTKRLFAFQISRFPGLTSHWLEKYFFGSQTKKVNVLLICVEGS